MQQVLTFFATAFAPKSVVAKHKLDYKGRTMAEAHKGMKLPDHAFHALAGHLITQLKDLGIAGPNEREFLLGVLTSVWQEEIKPNTHKQNDDPKFIPFDVNAISTTALPKAQTTTTTTTAAAAATTTSATAAPPTTTAAGAFFVGAKSCNLLQV